MKGAAVAHRWLTPASLDTTEKSFFKVPLEIVLMVEKRDVRSGVLGVGGGDAGS